MLGAIAMAMFAAPAFYSWKMDFDDYHFPQSSYIGFIEEKAYASVFNILGFGFVNRKKIEIF